MRKFFATNKLNTKDLFNERKKYQSYMEFYGKDKTKLIDLWNENFYYGRIDHIGDIVYPAEGFLKSIAQRQGEEQYLINFAADMFNDFIEFWNSLSSSQKLHPESKLLFISPKRSWVNVHVMYHDYMNILYTSFSNSIRLIHKPKDYENMIQMLFNFIQNDPRFNFMTKSAFIISKYSDPLISGLMVDIESHQHDLDRKKEDFIKDNNFIIFKNAAEKFGFKLDENAPWRMIVDIDSPKLEKYLNKYEITKKDFFNKFFYKAYEFDIDNLKAYTMGFWNKLVDQNLVQIPKCAPNNNIAVQRIKRPSAKIK